MANNLQHVHAKFTTFEPLYIVFEGVFFVYFLLAFFMGTNKIIFEEFFMFF